MSENTESLVVHAGRVQQELECYKLALLTIRAAIVTAESVSGAIEPFDWKPIADLCKETADNALDL